MAAGPAEPGIRASAQEDARDEGEMRMRRLSRLAIVSRSDERRESGERPEEEEEVFLSRSAGRAPEVEAAFHRHLHHQQTKRLHQLPQVAAGVCNRRRQDGGKVGAQLSTLEWEATRTRPQGRWAAGRWRDSTVMRLSAPALVLRRRPAGERLGGPNKGVDARGGD